MAENGELVHPKTKVAQDCIDVGNVPDAALREIMVALQADPKDIRTSISELSSFAPPSVGHPSGDYRELEQAKVNFGNKPLTVLTRSKYFDPTATAEQVAARRQAWIAGHDKIAALFTRGKNIMMPNTGHYIQLDQPNIVVSTVRTVVNDLRQTK